jgi:mono/diheme cytochrome c family protein
VSILIGPCLVLAALVEVFGPRSPARAAPAPAPAAKRLFLKRCQDCHERDGSGREMRKSFAAMPDFRSTAWHKKREDRQLVISILEGKGTRMPAFNGKLTKAQARELVTYVRSFAKQPARATDKADDNFQKRFRELQELYDQVDEQLRALTEQARHAP